MSHGPAVAEKVAVPDHVPQELVFDFDFYQDRRFENGTLEGIIALAREAPPIFFSQYNGGHWVVMGHPEMIEVVKHATLFSNAKVTIPTSADPSEYGLTFGPLHLDPPEHGPQRRALSQVMPPRDMRALEPAIRQVAVAILDRLAPTGRCEFVSDIAEPYPVTIVLQMMGLPDSRLYEFRQWAKDFITNADAEVKKAAMAQISEAMRDVIRQRRSTPGDDIISHLLAVEVTPGHGLTDDEAHGFCLLLFVGGLDTVTGGLCESIRYLCVDQNFQQHLRDHPEDLDAGVEELLRRGDPSAPGRIVADDAQFLGIRFKKGDRMALLFPGTGQDRRVYDDAAACRLDRKAPAHLAFGGGPHVCWGAPIARIEYRVLLEEMFARLPTFRLDPEQPAEFRRSHGHILGTETLHIAWSSVPSIDQETNR
jgi:cytochrome P450